MAKKSFFQKIQHAIRSLNLTIVLAVVLIVSVLVLWALFISGPNRVEEEKLRQAQTMIKEKVEAIEGVEQNSFRYITYQGYTDSKLYWFDANCDVIVTKDISKLDYDTAKRVAEETYGVICDTISLAYGYNNPVYEIEGSGKYLLLDFDTFERIYERDDQHGK
ncbi:MAG: hypothetical protein Q4C49_01280 [Bacillota bacterium]|nr:hypothetical protein [Bacillota bacterium]